MTLPTNSIAPLIVYSARMWLFENLKIRLDASWSFACSRRHHQRMANEKICMRNIRKHFCNIIQIRKRWTFPNRIQWNFICLDLSGLGAVDSFCLPKSVSVCPSDTIVHFILFYGVRNFTARFGRQMNGSMVIELYSFIERNKKKVQLKILAIAVSTSHWLGHVDRFGSRKFSLMNWSDKIVKKNSAIRNAHSFEVSVQLYRKLLSNVGEFNFNYLPLLQTKLSSSFAK